MAFSANAFSSYYSSPLGVMSRRFIRNKTYQFWPELRHYSLLGIGYAQPYLNRYMHQAERTLLSMPRVDDMKPFLYEDKNTLCITDLEEQPFPNQFFDRILIIHCLEFMGDVPKLLKECHRMLKPNGRILIIVPNRHSMWSRADATPFGNGSPFTPEQIKRYITESDFQIERMETALFTPPRNSAFIRKLSPLIEKYGPYAFFRFGGVHIIEVSKQVFATITPDKGSRIEAITGPILMPGASPS